MRKLSLILIASLSVLALVAMSAGAADACDKTASAKTATVEAAPAATATVAGAGCSSAKLSASVAGAGCSKSASAKAAVAIETVRMPSGALAVFYNGKTDASVAELHAGFEAKGASFGCNLASGMAENGDCVVEAATTETGIMLLVTSEKTEVIDEYQSAYQVASASHEAASDGE